MVLRGLAGPRQSSFPRRKARSSLSLIVNNSSLLKGTYIALHPLLVTPRLDRVSLVVSIKASAMTVQRFHRVSLYEAPPLCLVLEIARGGSRYGRHLATFSFKDDLTEGVRFQL